MSRTATSTTAKQSCNRVSTASGLYSNPRFSPGLLLAFLICSLSLFSFAIWLPESTFDWLNDNTARMAGYCLNLFGMHSVVQGRMLSLDGFAVIVSTECSTLYMCILFFSFVAACPSTLRHKFIGLPLGFAVLHAGNILRIAALFVIGLKSPRSFEITHVYFGQVLMAFFVLIVCLAWLKMGSGPASGKHDLLAFPIRFFAFTSIPFLLWLPLCKEYMNLSMAAAAAVFSLFGYHLTNTEHHEIYYHTFNVVTFTGLVLATTTRSLGRKLLTLAFGNIAIFLFLVLRVCVVLTTAYNDGPAQRIGAGIALCGQYILPLALWLLMVRKKA